MANRKKLWQKNGIVEVLKMANKEVSCVSCGGHMKQTQRDRVNNEDWEEKGQWSALWSTHQGKKEKEKENEEKEKEEEEEEEEEEKKEKEEKEKEEEEKEEEKEKKKEKRK